MVPIIVLLCVAALLVFLVVMTYRGNGMARYALKRILLLIPHGAAGMRYRIHLAAGGAHQRGGLHDLSVSNRRHHGGRGPSGAYAGHG